MGGIFDALFGGGDVPQAPQVTQPPVMPLPNDEATRKARRRSMARRQQGSGRESTILSDDYAGKLGG